MPGLVIHGTGVGLATGNQTVISTSVGVFDEDGFDIGYINQINSNFTRPTTRVRHLNKADAGRTVEQQPGVEDFTLTVSGFALYQKNDSDKRSLIARLPAGGGAFKVLNQQQVPFVVREEETHPATNATNVYVYMGCMINQYSRPVNVGTTTVTESATITPSWVE